MKLSKATLRKRVLERVKERARLAAAHEFQKDFEDWRKKIFSSIEKGDFSKFWLPIKISCAADLSSFFTLSQFALSDIFESSLWKKKEGK